MLGGWCPLGTRMWRLHWLDEETGLRYRRGQVWQWCHYGTVPGGVYVWYAYDMSGKLVMEGVARSYVKACRAVESVIKEPRQK